MGASSSRKVFISRVSREFGAFAETLRNSLQATHHDARTQVSFRQEADSVTTLDKLSLYIHQSDVVLALVGKLSGAYPPDSSLDTPIVPAPTGGTAAPTWRQLLPPGFAKLSYTQWEVILARYWKKTLYFYFGKLPDSTPLEITKDDDLDHQETFVRFLTKTLGADRESFTSATELENQVLKSLWPPAPAGADSAQPQNLPYRPLGDLFVGRGQALDDLRAALLSGSHRAGIHMSQSVAAAHGLGGIGKTRLACEYAWRHAGEYDALLFLNAASAESLDTAVAQLATVLVHHLDIAPDADHATRRAAVIAWLVAHPRSLLILDNIDDPEAVPAVRDLLRAVPRGHIILTGRIPRWPEGVTPLELTVLSPEDSADFLLRRTTQRIQKADDPATALLLAEKLDGLALLLEQAAAYINEHTLTLGGYLTTWEKKHTECLQWWDHTQSDYAGGIRPYGKSVFATWLTTVEQLPPPARFLLELCAWFTPDPIPAWILGNEYTPRLAELAEKFLAETTISKAAPPSSDPAAADSAPAETLFGLAQAPILTPDSLRALIRYGMATESFIGNPDSDLSRQFKLHRIVQDVTRQRLQHEGSAPQRRLAACLWVRELFVGRVDEVRDWPKFDPLAPHALALAEQAATAGGPLPPPAAWPTPNPAHTLSGRLYWPLALWASSHGRYDPAAEWGRRATTALHATLGPEHPDTLTSRNNLAIALQDQGKNAEAEAEHRAVLAIRERVLGLEHPDTLQSRNNLALVLWAQGKNAEAEAEHRAVLAIFERLLGPEHPDTLASRNNLANALDDQGKNADAEAEHRAVLAIRERVLGPEHHDTLASRNNLAAALQVQGKNAEAEAEFRAVLAIQERVLGPEHPDTLVSRNNLAIVLRAQGKIAEAEAEHRAVLALRERVLGPEHPDTLTSRNNLALALDDQGKNAEAEAELRVVLALRERVLGPEHPDLFLSHFNLALCLWKQEKWEEARTHAEAAWVGFQKVLGDGHPWTQAAKQLLDELSPSPLK